MTPNAANRYSSTSSPQHVFLKFIAYLQVIGIVFVVVGHSFHEYPDGAMGKTMLLYRMMHSFRMPLFMFVSGFLMVFTTFGRKGDGSPSPAEFMASKLKRLILPFAALTLVTFVPRVAMSSMADDAMELSMESFGRSLVYADRMVIPFFWFLQASFVLLIFSYAFIWLARKRHINIGAAIGVMVGVFALIPFTAITVPAEFSLDMAAKLGVYFSLGALYAHFAPVVDRYAHWSHWPTLCFWTLVWAALFFVTESTDFVPLCSVAGIAMCISLAQLLERHRIKMLDHLIGANYLIFLLSWFLNVATQQVLSHFVVLPWWIHTILSIVAGIYVPWVGYRYLRTHRHSRWCKAAAMLLGQKFS